MIHQYIATHQTYTNLKNNNVSIYCYSWKCFCKIYWASKHKM